jgi:hypothetical protein
MKFPSSSRVSEARAAPLCGAARPSILLSARLSPPLSLPDLDSAAAKSLAGSCRPLDIALRWLSASAAAKSRTARSCALSPRWSLPAAGRAGGAAPAAPAARRGITAERPPRCSLPPLPPLPLRPPAPPPAPVPRAAEQEEQEAQPAPPARRLLLRSLHAAAMGSASTSASTSASASSSTSSGLISGRPGVRRRCSEAREAEATAEEAAVAVEAAWREARRALRA